jgi:hypothetical protein
MQSLRGTSDTIIRPWQPVFRARPNGRLTRRTALLAIAGISSLLWAALTMLIVQVIT